MTNKPSNTHGLCIVGAGSWATALAITSARNHQSVCLWARDPDATATMTATRENQRYLPGITLPDDITLTADLKTAIQSTRDIVICVPSHAFRGLLQQLAPLLHPQHRLCWATKGLDPNTSALLHTVVSQEIPTSPTIAVLSGPSFATEVAKGLPTAITIASEDDPFADALIGYFHHQRFRVYRNRDVIGVEIGGAVKNVLAIATGVSDGLGFGANARAALITRGLQEIIRLGTVLGGQRDTFMGLAGLGDLVLTCTDDQSRNRRFGLAIGKGQDRQQAEKAIGQVVEGIRNADDVYRLAKQHQIDMPIVAQVHAILYDNKSPEAAVISLMQRVPTVE